MVRRAYLVVGAATAALVMTLVVASISSGSVLGQAKLGSSGSPPAGHQRPPDRLGPGHESFPHWVMIALSILLGLYGLGVILLMVFASRVRRPAEESLVLDTEEALPTGEWGALLSVELAGATEDLLADRGTGSARNAIVACWLRLQRATRSAGLPALASETSHEFTVRALRRLDLDSAAIATLSELYREARFSEHDMGESQRDRAIAALGVLAGQLSQARVPAPPDAVLDSVLR